MTETALSQALTAVLSRVHDDHARVAAALVGSPAPAPRDRELAGLFFAVVEGAGLLEAALDHPEAVARQVEWALVGRGSFPAVPTAQAVSLALAC